MSEANELCDKINKLCDEVLLGTSAHAKKDTDVPPVAKASLSAEQASGEVIEETRAAAREETAEEAGAEKERVAIADQVEEDRGSCSTTELAMTAEAQETTAAHASVEEGVDVGEQEQADTDSHTDAIQAAVGNEMSEEAELAPAVGDNITSGAAPDTRMAEVTEATDAVLASPKRKLNATGQVMDEKAAGNMDDVLSELNKVLAEGAHLDKGDVADLPADERVRRLSETVWRSSDGGFCVVRAMASFAQLKNVSSSFCMIINGLSYRYQHYRQSTRPKHCQPSSHFTRASTPT